MTLHLLYRISAESYLLVSAGVSSILCILGWVLFGRMTKNCLLSYTYWFLPAMIGSTFATTALLLTLLLQFFGPRDYMLGTVVYLFSVLSVLFHILFFVRLWKVIGGLPPSSGNLPLVQSNSDQDETVWPPQPRTPPSPQ